MNVGDVLNTWRAMTEIIVARGGVERCPRCGGPLHRSFGHCRRPTR